MKEMDVRRDSAAIPRLHGVGARDKRGHDVEALD